MDAPDTPLSPLAEASARGFVVPGGDAGTVGMGSRSGRSATMPA